VDRATVVGIDGGGTYTRAVAADVSGQALAAVQTGAASPNKTPHAEENVRQAIREVVAAAGRPLSDVVALVAGMAGLDSPQDRVWADRFLALPELNCPRIPVNDAVVAHAGALASRPGIIAISGTGSIIFGVTEDGTHLRNYDFHHYSSTAARHLAYDAVYQILSWRIQPEDVELVEEILAFWEVDDLSILRQMGTSGFIADSFERHRRFGEMAPLVTAAAERGIPVAEEVCDRAAEQLATGIALIGGCFREDTVEVALIGGAIRSPYLQRAVERALGWHPKTEYRIVEPLLSGAGGAALMALEAAGYLVTDSVREALRITSPPPTSGYPPPVRSGEGEPE